MNWINDTKWMILIHNEMNKHITKYHNQLLNNTNTQIMMNIWCNNSSFFIISFNLSIPTKYEKNHYNLTDNTCNSSFIILSQNITNIYWLILMIVQWFIIYC